jgi:carbonic anhydrase
MESYKKLLLGNKAWVQEKLAVDPRFFEHQARDQRPEFFWIGCSDSRVPAEDITGAQPGELFVHRNVANLVVHTDFNMLSVLQYAVEVLEVKHVIVCGHYDCGGVKNALTRHDFGLINKWLRHIKDVYRLHRRDLELIEEPQERLDRMVEINVMEQVNNLAETSIVQRAWKKHGRPVLHGWIYDLRTGQLKEQACLRPGAKLESIYLFDFWDEAPPEPQSRG